MDELRTQRLLLRRWRAEDEPEMARMNRDPEVGRYLNRPVDGPAVGAFFGYVVEHWETHGFGPWALESLEPETEGQLLGFAGLAHVPPFLSAAGSAPELGWRLSRAAWERGLATEAATAARDDAFGRLGLPEIISIIHPENQRPRRVATKLGLHRPAQIENPRARHRGRRLAARGEAPQPGEADARSAAIDDRAASLMGSAPSWPLVGRAGELELLASTRVDGRTAVAINGPAGVGKSRLAREALAQAEHDGHVTRWIQATRSAANLPLGAFAAVIPSAVRSDDLLELLQRTGEALREQSAGRTLVLGVDDAQWLDPTSATLVLHLATTGAAFVVVTVRAGEPVPDAIVSLWKDLGGVRLELGLLSEGETEALAQEIVGGALERRALRWVSETSRGNALYVRELMLGALADDALEKVSGLWRLRSRPPVSVSLSELVAARTNGLPAVQQYVLELLALGEPVHLAEMIALAGSEPLAATEARGLVSIGGIPANSEVRLSHPLYGEVIRAELPSLRARELRLVLVRTVEARASLEPDDALRLARWLIDAGEPITTDLMLRAARAANLAGDPAFGASLAERALDAGAGIEAVLLLARAHTVRGRFDEAARVLSSAEDGIPTQEAALEHLDQQSEVLHWGLKRPSELHDLLDRAAGWWPEATWQQRLEPLRLRVASFERLGVSLSTSAELMSGAAIDAEVRRQVEPVHVANLFYSGRTHEALELACRILPSRH